MRIPAIALAAILLAGCAGDEPDQDELIAFASNRGGDFDIYVMRADGTGTRVLTHAPDASRPAWSRDGRRIAFTSTRGHEGDGIEDQDVYVVDADGGNLRRLTSNQLAEFSPTWTKDGRVAFWRCRQTVSDCAFVAVAPDGGEETVLYRASGAVFGADLSPDGSTLLYTLNTDVYAVELGGGSPRRLTDDAAADGQAAWSPDGRTIVFLSDRDRNGRCLFHDCTGWTPELYVMDAAGEGERRLTETEAQEVSPVWSSGGEQIVFARIEDGTDDYELFVMDADGGDPAQLTDNDAFDWMPAVRRASRSP